MSTPPEAQSDVPPSPPAWLRKLTTVGASVAALGLGLSLFGLWPRRAAREVVPSAFDPEQAVARSQLPAPETAAEPANRLQLASFSLCDAPKEGARLYRLALAPDRDAFAVWCASEYVLIDVQARGDALEVTRAARFPARGELPGGAAALDLDRDGVIDLVLGVAPAAGVVHRAFSGVFWLRGRTAGGYEPARALVELPTVALAAVDLDAQPGSELAVLTRGDPAAQRPGELWLFTGGVAPKRAAVLPTGLAPTDLAAVAVSPTATDLLVVSTQPGAVVRLRVPRDAATWASAERSELSLRGAQALVPGPRAGTRLFVRDVLGVHALEAEPLRVTPWHGEARVGPSAWIDAPGRDGEERRALIGATERGFTWLEGATPRERTLPEGVRVVDASSLASVEPRGVLLVSTADTPARLALVVLPKLLRGEASEVSLRASPLVQPPGAPLVELLE